MLAIHMAICVNRAIDLVQGSEKLRRRIALLRVGYLMLITLLETCSSAFLLHILIKVHYVSPNLSPFNVYCSILRWSSQGIVSYSFYYLKSLLNLYSILNIKLVNS